MKKKKINKYILIVIILFLSSCDAWHDSWYYESYYNGKLSKPIRKTHPMYMMEDGKKKYVKKPNERSKEYCAYFISYFLPINFWNVRLTAGYMRKMIKELNEEGMKGSNMKDIYTHNTGFGSPVFSFACAEINGVVVE
jgi:hypothetical protein